MGIKSQVPFNRRCLSVKVGEVMLVVTGICLLGLGGCASGPRYSTTDSRRAAEAEDSERSPRRVSRSNEEEDTFGDAITAPLEDLNIRRTPIPAVLIRAARSPYDLSGLDTCSAIAAEVTQLDDVLGDDYDEAPPPDDRTMTERGGDAANEYAVGAVRSAARDVIPFRGIVRHLTGANSHQKQMDNAIQAGRARRAYLKGIGMNKNCAPPAAPSWFRPRVYVEAPKPETRPTAPSQPARQPSRQTSRRHR